MKCQVVCVAGRKALLSGCHIKCLGHGARGKDVLRRSETKRNAGLQHQHVIANRCRHVEIVQRSHDCQRQITDQRQHFELMDTAQDALDHAHQQKLAAKAAAQEALALVREARELAQLAEKHGVSACAEQQHDVDVACGSPSGGDGASVVVAVDESLQRLTAAMARDAAVARQRSAMDIRFNSLQLGAGLDR